MLLWNGACIVHDEFKGLELELLRSAASRARWCWCIPSRPKSVVEQADVVGSTSQLLKAVVEGEAQEYIVATDNGMLHRMRQLAPGKTLIEAPTAGNSATCKSCAHCPWMAMNALQGVRRSAWSTAAARSTSRADARAGARLHRAHARLRRHAPRRDRTSRAGLRAEHRRRLRALRDLDFDRNETLAEARARNIRDALLEDIGRGDWTGQLVPAGQRVHARVLRARGRRAVRPRLVRGCVHALDPTRASTGTTPKARDMRGRHDGVPHRSATRARCCPPSGRR